MSENEFSIPPLVKGNEKGRIELAIHEVVFELDSTTAPPSLSSAIDACNSNRAQLFVYPVWWGSRASKAKCIRPLHRPCGPHTTASFEDARSRSQLALPKVSTMEQNMITHFSICTDINGLISYLEDIPNNKLFCYLLIEGTPPYVESTDFVNEPNGESANYSGEDSANPMQVVLGCTEIDLTEVVSKLKISVLTHHNEAGWKSNLLHFASTFGKAKIIHNAPEGDGWDEGGVDAITVATCIFSCRIIYEDDESLPAVASPGTLPVTHSANTLLPFAQHVDVTPTESSLMIGRSLTGNSDGEFLTRKSLDVTSDTDLSTWKDYWKIQDEALSPFLSREVTALSGTEVGGSDPNNALSIGSNPHRNNPEPKIPHALRQQEHSITEHIQEVSDGSLLLHNTWALELSMVVDSTKIEGENKASMENTPSFEGVNNTLEVPLDFEASFATGKNESGIFSDAEKKMLEHLDSSFLLAESQVIKDLSDSVSTVAAVAALQKSMSKLELRSTSVENSEPKSPFSPNKRTKSSIFPDVNALSPKSLSLRTKNEILNLAATGPRVDPIPNSDKLQYFSNNLIPNDSLVDSATDPEKISSTWVSSILPPTVSGIPANYTYRNSKMYGRTPPSSKEKGPGQHPSADSLSKDPVIRALFQVESEREDMPNVAVDRSATDKEVTRTRDQIQEILQRTVSTIQAIDSVITVPSTSPRLHSRASGLSSSFTESNDHLSISDMHKNAEDDNRHEIDSPVVAKSGDHNSKLSSSPSMEYPPPDSVRQSLLPQSPGLSRSERTALAFEALKQRLDPHARKYIKSERKESTHETRSLSPSEHNSSIPCDSTTEDVAQQSSIGARQPATITSVTSPSESLQSPNVPISRLHILLQCIAPSLSLPSLLSTAERLTNLLSRVSGIQIHLSALALAPAATVNSAHHSTGTFGGLALLTMDPIPQADGKSPLRLRNRRERNMPESDGYSVLLARVLSKENLKVLHTWLSECSFTIECEFPTNTVRSEQVDSASNAHDDSLHSKASIHNFSYTLPPLSSQRKRGRSESRIGFQRNTIIDYSSNAFIQHPSTPGSDIAALSHLLSTMPVPTHVPDQFLTNKSDHAAFKGRGLLSNTYVNDLSPEAMIPLLDCPNTIDRELSLSVDEANSWLASADINKQAPTPKHQNAQSIEGRMSFRLYLHPPEQQFENQLNQKRRHTPALRTASSSSGNALPQDKISIASGSISLAPLLLQPNRSLDIPVNLYFPLDSSLNESHATTEVKASGSLELESPESRQVSWLSGLDLSPDEKSRIEKALTTTKAWKRMGQNGTCDRTDGQDKLPRAELVARLFVRTKLILSENKKEAQELLPGNKISLSQAISRAMHEQSHKHHTDPDFASRTVSSSSKPGLLAYIAVDRESPVAPLVPSQLKLSEFDAAKEESLFESIISGVKGLYCGVSPVQMRHAFAFVESFVCRSSSSSPITDKETANDEGKERSRASQSMFPVPVSLVLLFQSLLSLLHQYSLQIPKRHLPFERSSSDQKNDRKTQGNVLKHWTMEDEENMLKDESARLWEMRRIPFRGDQDTSIRLSPSQLLGGIADDLQLLLLKFVTSAQIIDATVFSKAYAPHPMLSIIPEHLLIACSSILRSGKSPTFTASPSTASFCTLFSLSNISFKSAQVIKNDLLTDGNERNHCLWELIEKEYTGLELDISFPLGFFQPGGVISYPLNRTSATTLAISTRHRRNTSCHSNLCTRMLSGNQANIRSASHKGLTGKYSHCPPHIAQECIMPLRAAMTAAEAATMAASFSAKANNVHRISEDPKLVSQTHIQFSIVGSKKLNQDQGTRRVVLASTFLPVQSLVPGLLASTLSLSREGAALDDVGTDRWTRLRDAISAWTHSLTQVASSNGDTTSSTRSSLWTLGESASRLNQLTNILYAPHEGNDILLPLPILQNSFPSPIGDLILSFSPTRALQRLWQNDAESYSSCVADEVEKSPFIELNARGYIGSAPQIMHQWSRVLAARIIQVWYRTKKYGLCSGWCSEATALVEMAQEMKENRTEALLEEHEAPQPIEKVDLAVENGTYLDTEPRTIMDRQKLPLPNTPNVFDISIDSTIDSIGQKDDPYRSDMAEESNSDEYGGNNRGHDTGVSNLFEYSLSDYDSMNESTYLSEEEFKKTPLVQDEIQNSSVQETGSRSPINSLDIAVDVVPAPSVSVDVGTKREPRRYRASAMELEVEYIGASDSLLSKQLPHEQSFLYKSIINMYSGSLDLLQDTDVSSVPNDAVIGHLYWMYILPEESKENRRNGMRYSELDRSHGTILSSESNNNRRIVSSYGAPVYWREVSVAVNDLLSQANTSLDKRRLLRGSVNFCRKSSNSNVAVSRKDLRIVKEWNHRHLFLFPPEFESTPSMVCLLQIRLTDCFPLPIPSGFLKSFSNRARYGTSPFPLSQTLLDEGAEPASIVAKKIGLTALSQLFESLSAGGMKSAVNSKDVARNPRSETIVPIAYTCIPLYPDTMALEPLSLQRQIFLVSETILPVIQSVASEKDDSLQTSASWSEVHTLLSNEYSKEMESSTTIESVNDMEYPHVIPHEMLVVSLRYIGTTEEVSSTSATLPTDALIVISESERIFPLQPASKAVLSSCDESTEPSSIPNDLVLEERSVDKSNTISSVSGTPEIKHFVPSKDLVIPETFSLPELQNIVTGLDATMSRTLLLGSQSEGIQVDNNPLSPVDISTEDVSTVHEISIVEGYDKTEEEQSTVLVHREATADAGELSDEDYDLSNLLALTVNVNKSQLGVLGSETHSVIPKSHAMDALQVDFDNAAPLGIFSYDNDNYLETNDASVGPKFLPCSDIDSIVSHNNGSDLLESFQDPFDTSFSCKSSDDSIVTTPGPSESLDHSVLHIDPVIATYSCAENTNTKHKIDDAPYALTTPPSHDTESSEQLTTAIVDVIDQHKEGHQLDNVFIGQGEQLTIFDPSSDEKYIEILVSDSPSSEEVEERPAQNGTAHPTSSPSVAHIVDYSTTSYDPDVEISSVEAQARGKFPTLDSREQYSFKNHSHSIIETSEKLAAPVLSPLAFAGSVDKGNICEEFEEASVCQEFRLTDAAGDTVEEEDQDRKTLLHSNSHGEFSTTPEERSLSNVPTEAIYDTDKPVSVANNISAPEITSFIEPTPMVGLGSEVVPSPSEMMPHQPNALVDDHGGEFTSLSSELPRPTSVPNQETRLIPDISLQSIIVPQTSSNDLITDAVLMKKTQEDMRQMLQQAVYSNVPALVDAFDKQPHIPIIVPRTRSPEKPPVEIIPAPMLEESFKNLRKMWGLPPEIETEMEAFAVPPKISAKDKLLQVSSSIQSNAVAAIPDRLAAEGLSNEIGTKGAAVNNKGTLHENSASEQYHNILQSDAIVNRNKAKDKFAFLLRGKKV